MFPAVWENQDRSSMESALPLGMHGEMRLICTDQIHSGFRTIQVHRGFVFKHPCCHDRPPPHNSMKKNTRVWREIKRKTRIPFNIAKLQSPTQKTSRSISKKHQQIPGLIANISSFMSAQQVRLSLTPWQKILSAASTQIIVEKYRPHYTYSIDITQ